MVFDFCRAVIQWLFFNSLKVSLLTGPALFLTIFLKNKLKVRWVCYIYLALVLRLILPVNLISWRLPGLFNRPALLPVSSNPSSNPSSNLSSNPFSSPSTAPVFGPGPVDGEPAGPKMPDRAGKIIPAVSKSRRVITAFFSGEYSNYGTYGMYMESLLLLVWFTGFIILLSLYIYKNRSFYRLLKKETSVSDRATRQLLGFCKKKTRVSRPVRVTESSLLANPLIIGIVRPAIVIPRGLASQLSKKELSFVLLHELTHWKRKDLLIQLFITLISFLHWFNPLLWFLKSEIRRLSELACDEQVLELIGEQETKDYGSLILKILRLSRDSQKTKLSLTAHFLPAKLLTRRITMISHYKHNKNIKKSMVYILTAVLLFGAGLTLSFTSLKGGSAAAGTDISRDNSDQELTIQEEKISLLWPVADNKGRITSGYGNRKHPAKKKLLFHEGIDIAWKQGTPIIAAGDGVVREVTYTESMGNYIILSHGNGMTTTYAKLEAAVEVKPNQQVKAGQVIGYLGNSGISTGPHLHFTVKIGDEPRNPLDFMEVPLEEKAETQKTTQELEKGLSTKTLMKGGEKK